jgi:uncharacterized membrane protein YgdD (TMEM256/DUF423 family)
MKALAILAGLSGALAVIAGAYGVHGAIGQAASWFGTGSHYQLVHAVAVMAVMHRPLGRLAGWCFVAGTALFAGSLYALALGAPHILGIVPPFGGAAMIAGWLALAVGAWREASPSHRSS